MKWTLIIPAGTNDPDTDNTYRGLDRFGRGKDNRLIDADHCRSIPSLWHLLVRESNWQPPRPDRCIT